MLRQIVATARSLPQRLTIRQTDAAVKNITTGRKAPYWAVVMAAKADTDAKTKNNTPTAASMVRCDLTYLYSSFPDSKWLSIGENNFLNAVFMRIISGVDLTHKAKNRN